MKKILIVYATAGIGHKKASMAVKEAFDEMAPKDAEVTLIDALDYTNDFFRWSYLQAYLLMVNKLPTLWGLSYYFTDNRYVDIIVSALRRINNWFNSGKLVQYIKDSKPDVVISTHFLPSEVISDLKEVGETQARLVTVVTDYRLHSWWVCDFTDTYVVASQEAKNDLIGWKVDPSKIKVLGIPVEPVFTKTMDKDKTLEKLGLKKDIFTVLVVGGGFGVGPIEEIVKSVDEVSRPIQIVTICGHNEELVGKLNALKPKLKSHLTVTGFADNVYEYMEASDILISKSGGITVSESLAKEIPMVIISPILGQETRNSDFLIGNGAAMKIAKPSELKALIEDLLSHPEKLTNMKEAIRKVRKPYACYDVVKLVLS